MPILKTLSAACILAFASLAATDSQAIPAKGGARSIVFQTGAGDNTVLSRGKSGTRKPARCRLVSSPHPHVECN